MPKEVIYDEQYGVKVRFDSADGSVVTPSDIVEGDDTLHTVSTAMLKVAWGRDTYVSLASVNDDDPDGFEAQHVNLDRAGINRLIRTLRKARDQAYGADA